MHMNRLLLHFFLLLIVSMAAMSCHREKKPATVPIETTIDSLNKIYNQPSMAIPDNLPVVSKNLTLSDSLDYLKGFVNASILGYRIYFESGRYREALRMLENARKKLEDYDLPVLEAKVEYLMGLFHSYIRKYDVAYNFFINSIEKYKQANDTMRLANAYTELGRMYDRTQNWTLAKKYLWMAYRYDLSLNNTRKQALELDIIATSYQRSGQIDSAEILYKKSYNICERIMDPKLLAQSLINFGGFYADLGRNDKAEELLLRALHFSDSIPDEKDVTAITPYIFTNLGVLYNKKKQYPLAKSYLGKALSLVTPDIDLVTLANMNYEFYLCCRELKMYDEACHAIDTYVVLVDSNLRKNNRENLMALEMKYIYTEQQKEQQARQQRLKFLLTGLGILSIFIIFLLLLLYRQQRVNAKNVKLEKKIVDAELERRSRELASHVLNMARINDRKLSLIRTLREQIPSVKKENQQVVMKVIEGFEIDQDESLWKEFELRFTEVHLEFYAKLSKLNPNLTLNEKRLCAFLRLNMSSKEISCITGQSIKAIEQARFRLRKQLGLLNQNVNISNFLSSL